MVSILPDGMSNLEATISFLIIDTIALILRVISRIQTKSTTTTGQFIRYDDWWILAAYLMFASHCILIVCGEYIQSPKQMFYSNVSSRHHENIRYPRTIFNHGFRSSIENAPGRVP